VTSKGTLSVRKLSAVPNVIGREKQPHSITNTKPTPENGCDNWSFLIGICNFLKAARLMRLRAAPPSIRTWYNLLLAMVGETSNGSCPTPDMRFRQSEALNPINVSTHLRCGAAFGAGAAAAISRRKVLTMRLDVMSQEPLNMAWSALWCSLSLDSELEWP
jgi:hypothetical protein